MRSPILAVGRCPRCDGQLEPVQVNPGVMHPHFACRECRDVYAMGANWTLVPCESAREHLDDAPQHQRALDEVIDKMVPL
jgi:uncharacterized protein with PIN domain